MTADDISKLTIGEVEAIVERASTALARYREAQRMLGMPPVAIAPPAPTPNERTPVSRTPLEPHEAALKAQLMGQFKPGDLPPDIERLEGVGNG